MRVVFGEPSVMAADTAGLVRRLVHLRAARRGVDLVVGCCELKPVETRVEDTALFQCLKLKYDNLLSSFAFNFNLRHYVVELVVQEPTLLAGAAAGVQCEDVTD